MKRIIIITVILFSTLVLSAQKKTDFYRHEARFSYGILVIPNYYGGFTANYMYHVSKWLWVGANINWQFPSDIEDYRWREYYIDDTFKDFEISKRDKFFAIAPEFRFSHTNLKWATLYSALSAGYGIHTGIKKSPLDDFDYWYWNITLFGGNFHIGKKQNIIVGGELGLGFKGVYTIHAGYRF